MHYFAFLQVQNFYVGELARQRNELADQTLIVIKDGLVLDASQDAFQRGVECGLPEKQAKALVENAIFIPWQTDFYTNASYAWLDRLVAFSDVIEPASQHSAFIDLSCHPAPQSLLMPLVMAAANGSYRIQLGAGPRKWLAELSVYWPVRFLDDVELAESLWDVPVNYLLPVSLAARQRLSFLGYSTIGEVQRVPIEILRAQFGTEGKVIFDACRGGHFEPVEANYPLNSVRAQIVFDGAVDSSEGIELALGELALQLAVQLSETDASGTEICLSLETEENGFITRTRTFTNPIFSKLTAQTALILTLGDAVQEPIVAIKVVMPRLSKQAGVQTPMSITSDHLRQQNMATIERLQKSFGEKAILRASELQPLWHKRFQKIWEHCLGHG